MNFRPEGHSYKSGLNILGSVHWKCPYFGLVHVKVDLADGTVVKRGFRFRLWSKGMMNGWQGPRFFNYSGTYNHIENHLDIIGCVDFRKEDYDRYVEYREDAERTQAREARKLQKFVAERQAEGPRPPKTRWRAMPLVEDLLKD